MDIRDEEAQRLFFVSELGAARESSDIDKARHKAEQALEYAAARGIIDRIPRSVLPMVAEMIIDEDGYEPDPLLGDGETHPPTRPLLSPPEVEPPEEALRNGPERRPWRP